MITAKFEFTTAPYASGRTFENRFNRLVSGLGRQVAQDMQPLVGRAFAPLSPIRYPIPWTLSPLPEGKRPNMPGGKYSKQKAAFFATNGFGKGIPYRRTGQRQAAWHYRFVTDGTGGGRFELVNDDPTSRYVYGALRPQGKYRQRMFNGIWPTATEGRDIVFDGTRNLLRERFAESVGSLGILETGGK